MGVPEIKDVMVIGGGGNIGPSILNALHAETFAVSVLSRESSKSTFPSHITVHRIDDSYPEDKLLAAFTGRDAIVCAVNFQNVRQQIKFIDVAIQARVKWFVPAEFGANKEAAKHGEKLALHEAKVEVSEHLTKVESKGLSWTAVATGPFIDWGIANGFCGFDIKARRAKIYGSGDERWTGTTVSTIGIAVARLLRNPQEVQNRFIYVYSVATSQNEILSNLETATGANWDTHHVKWEDEIPAGRKKLEQGDQSGGFPLVLSQFYQSGMGADYTNDVEAANALLELPTETVQEIVRKVLALT